MSIKLTLHQQQALDSEEDIPLQVIYPCTNTSYILVRAVEDESLRELLGEEGRQAVHAVGLRNAASRIDVIP